MGVELVIRLVLPSKEVEFNGFLLSTMYEHTLKTTLIDGVNGKGMNESQLRDVAINFARSQGGYSEDDPKLTEGLRKLFFNREKEE